jgi:hypothetical protein
LDVLVLEKFVARFGISFFRSLCDTVEVSNFTITETCDQPALEPLLLQSLFRSLSDVTSQLTVKVKHGENYVYFPNIRMGKIKPASIAF